MRAALSVAEWNAILLSLKVAGTGVLLSLPLGIAIAWLLARREFFGKSLVETLINLPLVLPPVVTGYFLLITFGRKGYLGGVLESWLGLRLIFDWKGAALAAAVTSFPLMVRAMRIAFTTVNPKLEQAARTLGAGPVDTFFSITLPLAKHGVIAGCVLAFARCLGEFGATIMIAGNIEGETRTIPLYIYNQLDNPDGLSHSTGIILFSVLIAAAALMTGEWLERRSRKYAA